MRIDLTCIYFWCFGGTGHSFPYWTCVYYIHGAKPQPPTPPVSSKATSGPCFWHKNTRTYTYFPNACCTRRAKKVGLNLQKLTCYADSCEDWQQLCLLIYLFIYSHCRDDRCSLKELHEACVTEGHTMCPQPLLCFSIYFLYHIFPLLFVPVKSVSNLKYSLVYFTLCCSIILYIVVFIFFVA